jgi:hypothetical protein
MAKHIPNYTDKRTVGVSIPLVLLTNDSMA